MAKIIPFPANGAGKPGFTPAARRMWNTIPPDVRELLVSNAYCRHCKASTSIASLGGKVEGGLLVLQGRCTTCGAHVVRVVD